VAPEEVVHWCEVWWPWRRSRRPAPVWSSNYQWWDVLVPDPKSELQLRCAATMFLVAFLPETPSKSVHWAIRVTSKAQSESQAQCPPKQQQSIVGAGEEMQHEGLLQARHGRWKSSVHEKLDLHIAIWFCTESKQQPGIFECTCQYLLCWCLLCIEVSVHMLEHLVLIGHKLQPFKRILKWFCLISNLS
jgi:hypothetical protein